MESTRAVTCILISLILGLELVNSESSEEQKSTNRSTDASGLINVLIVTYSRSGSSFAGELFSSHNESSYIFEPLYYPALILGNATSEAYQEVLTKLLNCDTDMLDKVREDPIMVMIRKFGSIDDHFLEPKYNSQQVADLCEASTNRVIKTIRLSLSDALQLMQSGNVPNLKILHLVRDPRPRYNSVMSKTGFWNSAERNLNSVCGRMERDLLVAESVPSSRYMRVKYEELVSDPETVAKGVYASIFGMEKLPEEAQRYIQTHAKTGNPRHVNYYSTIRDSNFVPGHWEHDLNQTTIEMVQNNPSCKYVIEKLNYPMKKFN